MRPVRALELRHHVVAGVDAGGAADALELQAVADVDAGRADTTTQRPQSTQSPRARRALALPRGSPRFAS